MGRPKVKPELKKSAQINMRVQQKFKDGVERKAEEKGYASITAYIEALVREDN